MRSPTLRAAAGLLILAISLSGCRCDAPHDVPGSTGDTSETPTTQASQSPPPPGSRGPAVADGPPVGRLSAKRCVVHGFEDEAVNDLVAAYGPAFHTCISRAAAAAPSMASANWTLDMWASADGVPRTQNVAGNFTTDAAFDAMVGCTSDAASALQFGPATVAEPRVTCDFSWVRE